MLNINSLLRQQLPFWQYKKLKAQFKISQSYVINATIHYFVLRYFLQME